uniref:Uncharacterized protein n=1 Tax=Anguilla anguilla TaxID=7936 RepID=A0A0E9V5Q5_ANGAN
MLLDVCGIYPLLISMVPPHQPQGVLHDTTQKQHNTTTNVNTTTPHDTTPHNTTMRTGHSAQHCFSFS